MSVQCRFRKSTGNYSIPGLGRCVSRYCLLDHPWDNSLARKRKPSTQCPYPPVWRAIHFNRPGLADFSRRCFLELNPMTPLSIESLKAVSLKSIPPTLTDIFWLVAVASAAKTRDNSWAEAEFSQSKWHSPIPWQTFFWLVSVASAA